MAADLEEYATPDRSAGNRPAVRVTQSAPKKIRRCALFCGLAFLTGCDTGWDKAGASRQDFYQERSICSDEAQRPGGAAYRDPLTGAITQQWYTNQRLFNACMKEHGWSQPISH